MREGSVSGHYRTRSPNNCSGLILFQREGTDPEEDRLAHSLAGSCSELQVNQSLSRHRPLLLQSLWPWVVPSGCSGDYREERLKSMLLPAPLFASRYKNNLTWKQSLWHQNWGLVGRVPCPVFGIAQTFLCGERGKDWKVMKCQVTTGSFYSAIFFSSTVVSTVCVRARKMFLK